MPHSGIPGSKLICSSPGLFAAYRALRRLLKPRHPPSALIEFLVSLLYFMTRMRLLKACASLGLSFDVFFDCSVFYCSRMSKIFRALGPPAAGSGPLRFPRYVFQDSRRHRGNPALQARAFKTCLAASCSACVSKKEVFQPHLPVRLPCYDLAPVTSLTLGLSSRLRTSGTSGFHGLTGGVYKARERIHRAMADARLLANPASWGRVSDPSPN